MRTMNVLPSPTRLTRLDVAVVQSGQLADEGQPDSGAFMGSADDAADLVEAFEDQRELIGRDAGPGVAHSQFDSVGVGPEADADLAGQGEFHRIG
jgi:hypothetical protein